MAKGKCEDCGGECYPGSRRCRACSIVARREHFAAGSNGVKRNQIAAMYRAGVPVKDMAKHFNMGVGSMSIAINRLRNQYGYDLPYRHVISEQGQKAMRENRAKR